jgi:enolase
VNRSIDKVIGRRVWDSRGRPTVEAEVRLAGGAAARAIAPAGASKGSGEALDKRDGGPSFGGYDVSRAVAAVNEQISNALRGLDCSDQSTIDRTMIELDGTANKSRLGGNAMIAVSMAAAHAAASASELPLWRYLAGGRDDIRLPLPEIQIFGGGAHAGRRVDVQDFMIICPGRRRLRRGPGLDRRGLPRSRPPDGCGRLLMGVADEGGWWPAFDSNETGLDYLVRAIERAGYVPGEDVAISLDIAATDFGRNGRYRLAREGRELDSDGLTAMLLDWLERYPIVAIEDPLAEDDHEAMARFTAAAGDGVEVVADDFICTDAARIERASAIGACNTALIKPNQAGTLTETLAALDAARAAGWQAIVSARSGETEDVTIVHLAVGWGVKQLKVGSFTRSERMAKWNEGLRIAEFLEVDRNLAPRNTFPWG